MKIKEIILNYACRLFLFFLCVIFLPISSFASDSICAQVKIEIKQELTLERQAFEAHMRINNGLTNISVENVDINVNFADEDGNSVLTTTDPNNTDALFFISLDSMENIDDIEGSGTVQPSTSADIYWLIIPAPGASNGVPQGTMYYVGATLSYTIGGAEKTVEVSPDYIFVKPMPELTLDYFLPSDVYGDDAFTQQIEPPVPFSLGVRVQNNGAGAAKSLKIESAQPEIVENELGLLIGFIIEGSEVDGEPATESLLVDFGDIEPNTAGVARWIMICTLSGKFIEFTADYTHSDELGGELTSLLEAVNTHFLVHDVLVDLPGRDNIRDFLADDNGEYNVYESDNVDTQVYDQSASSSLQLVGQSGTEVTYTLSTPVTAGLMYVKLSDPHMGTKIFKEVIRSDGKNIPLDNAWLSKTRDSNNVWEYFFNLFDANTTNSYTVIFDDEPEGPHPPVLQYIPDKTRKEGVQLAFLVEASDPDGTIPSLSASPLPALATFTDKGDGTGVFDWTPAIGQAGEYNITFTASDGVLKDTQNVILNISTDEPTVRHVPSEYNTIQAAIDASQNGDTVLVADGEYLENINFKGRAITVRSENGVNATIIDGNSPCDPDLASVVTFNSGEGENSKLDGFTIKSGSGTNVLGDGVKYGGGILCNNFSSPQIINCTITLNSAVYGGGLYCLNSSSPTITRCIFRNNSASGDGGAISCSSSSPTMINCNIINNSAGNNGGGISGWNSDYKLINCTLSANSANQYGGGILSSASTPLVVNSILWGDTAGGSPNEIHLYDENSFITVAYSDIEGGDPEDSNQPYPGDGNIKENPLFEKYDSYHLKTDSPCIDKGTNNKSTYPNLPLDDIDGHDRPEGTGYDMGSDEYIHCTDEDGDGYAIDGDKCGPIDCDDSDPTVYPGAPELCDSMGMIVPAYFKLEEAWDELWAKLISASTKGVRIIAVINPLIGPGHSQNQKYVEKIQAFHDAGGEAIGYVHTSFGNRCIENVKAEVSKFYDFYNIDGIFFDEMSIDPEKVDYYRELYEHVDSKGGMVVGNANPGTNLDESYMETVTILNVFESNDCEPPNCNPPDWVWKYQPSKFSNLLWEVQDIRMIGKNINWALNRNTGWIYITDKGLPDPWYTLPTEYWERLIEFFIPGKDNDCDGKTDDGPTYYLDADGDYFGDPDSFSDTCDNHQGYVLNNTDCDDGNAEINPIVIEVCDNLVDENCDGRIGQGTPSIFYKDADEDGYGDPDSIIGICSSEETCFTSPEGYVSDNTDCNDSNEDINKSTTEICDGIDNDCDGQIDEEGCRECPIYVDDDCTNPGSGTTVDPYCTIQKAIDTAPDGCTIIVKNGTYPENINFNGKAVIVQTTEGAIIDGSGSGSVVTFNQGECPDSVLEGFTIRNGGGTYSEIFGLTFGGGIYCYDSSPSINNCIILNNSVSGDGGGIYCYFSSPSLTRCIIRNNTAKYSGGGIFSSYSAPTLINCLINGNNAFSEDEHESNGGGVYCYSSSLAISNCTLADNSAKTNGGGIACAHSSYLTIVNTILWGDEAGNNPKEIYLPSDEFYPSSITITYSDIDGGWGTDEEMEENNNINADPEFVNDYHLKPGSLGERGSPCIYAGTSDGAPLDDLDGDSRPKVDGHDIGSDEVACPDKDGDGYFGHEGCNTEVDCNDQNRMINPEAIEACDDIDNILRRWY